MITFKIVKPKRVLLVVCVLVVALASSAGVIGAVNAAQKKLPVYCTDSANKIAISFDASWGADKTRRIADLMTSYGTTATFFLTGIWIDAFPDEVKYLSEKGFEIGNHSQNHYNMTGLNTNKIYEELDLVNDKVKALTGTVPKVFRAPFGAYDNKLLNCVEKRDMTCVQWSVDSLDWKGLTKQELEDRVIPALKGGAIILCHNNSDHILEALPAIVESALSKGLKFVAMSELIYREDYVIDSNGKQCRKHSGGEL